MSLPRNDFEYNTAKSFEEMRTATNNPHLFSTLRDRGYNANLICLHGFQHVNPIKLRPWSDDLPPLWETNNFPELLARFDALTDGAPFAVYVWDLITHIEHSLALASHATGLTDQIRRACAVADDAVGAMREILERKGLMDNTTIVLYGDHGDDIWTHGFRGGMTHGTEPYTDIVWTPLMIRDPDVAPGTVDQLASTIDIAPTCLSLLGIDASYAFPHSGVDLLRGGSEFAYSQNFTANQRDNPLTDIAKAFSVHDKTYTLLASSRGLELYAHRLDQGNHCNLLHFFALNRQGHPELQAQPPRHCITGQRGTTIRAPSKVWRAISSDCAVRSPPASALSARTSSSVMAKPRMRSIRRVSIRSAWKVATHFSTGRPRWARFALSCLRWSFLTSCGEGTFQERLVSPAT